MSHSVRNRRARFLAAAEGYLTLGMAEHALRTLREIEDPDQALFQVNYLKGEAFKHLERHAEALVAYGRAFAEQPDHVDLLMGMAWCFKRTDQLPKAITAMERAYQIAPKEPVILYNLSCYWSLARNKTQALSWLGRALRMDQNLRRLIDEETDFDPLRSDPDFRLIVGGAATTQGK
ncbi:MAG: TPR end-of-group domain-containing protein [Planctomycetales bacterium]